MGGKTRSYAIIGTGAVGGYYGARLAHAGCHVHFLLNSDYDHVARHGLRVESPDGDFSIAEPHAYAKAPDVPACDVVMVALKSTANAVLADVLPPIVGPDTTVLLMQNGLGEEERIARIVPGAAIVGGLAFLCSHKVGPGHIRHLDYGQVRLGLHTESGEPGGVTETMRGIGEDLERAGISVVLEEHLALARWKKLVWNVPYNGLSVVLSTTTDHIMQHADTRALAAALMDEVAEGAAACGCVIEPEFVRAMLENTDKMVPYAPSMKLDYDAGRPLEIAAIYANPLEAAAAHGVDLPRIETLYRQLAFFDAHNPHRPA